MTIAAATCSVSTSSSHRSTTRSVPTIWISVTNAPGLLRRVQMQPDNTSANTPHRGYRPIECPVTRGGVRPGDSSREANRYYLTWTSPLRARPSAYRPIWFSPRAGGRLRDEGAAGLGFLAPARTLDLGTRRFDQHAASGNVT